MSNSTLTDALKEAYAHATNDPILDTLEFRHDSFVGAFRVVRDFTDLEARLESDAPLNANQYVTFSALAFTMNLPRNDDGGVARLQISLDNASAYMYSVFDQIVLTQSPLVVTYRPYLANDLTGPAMNPPITLDIVSMNMTQHAIQMEASIREFQNLPFPNKFYSLTDFPAL